MRLTWINVDLPDEPRWGDRWSEQGNDAGQPLYMIRNKHRSTLALWVVSRGDGSLVGEGDTLEFCKTLAREDAADA